MSEPTVNQTEDQTGKASDVVPEPTTRYFVLEQKGEPDGGWQEIAAVSARSAEAAIRDALAGDNTPAAAGTYVAVPARSWRPVTVKAVQTTVLKLEDATA